MMEKHTRGKAESLDSFELDANAINELASIGYNSIMTAIKEKSPSKTKESTTPPCKDWFKSTTYLQDDENFQVSCDMDNVSSSDGLFVLDCVGSKKLKGKFEEEELTGSESKVETSMVSLPSDEDVKSKKAARVKKVNKIKKNPEYCLSSTIDPHLDKLLTKNKSAVDKVLNTTKLAADPTSEIISKRQKKKMNKERRDTVCSDKWFNMKAPELTKDVKNQLSVLQLREILDRKNFYKSNDRKKFPKFFQMGKVVESAADFYHARIPKKQRKATLLDEVMADADLRKYQKRKYAEIFGDAKKTKNKKKRKPVST